MANSTHSRAIELTVCICTFRRPSVLAAIGSIANHSELPNLKVRILVVDNDSAPTARNIVTEFRSRTDMHVDYKHVPGQNISAPRNAGLDAAITPWLVFVDDDQYASTN